MKTRPTPAPLPDPLTEALLRSIRPVTPPRAARLKARVLGRVRREAARCADPLITTIPDSAEGWQELIPNIFAKRVFTDGVAESWLVRMQAGALAPAHDHPALEECIVLSGSVRYVGGSTLRAGDYEVVQPGAHHTELVSDHGALVFLRYAAPLSQYLPQL
ncbi:MAG: cupin domain-containing protein [Betaproteobacteria bacterium]|nr:cupin domain-containing protein [Betaproteobacteria bacterium]